MQIHQPVLSLLCHLRVMLSTRGVFFGPHPMHHVYCLLACIILQLTIRYSYKTIFFILFPFSNANGVIGFSFNPFFHIKSFSVSFLSQLFYPIKSRLEMNDSKCTCTEFNYLYNLPIPILCGLGET